MNINFFESIIKEHIINTYNKSPTIEKLDFKSFFWHSDYKEDNIFIAIKGVNTDGNFFIPEAIKNGYKVIISDHINYIDKYKDEYKHIYFIYVNSIQVVLDEFASYGINNYYGKKISITGSAGKTTTTYLLNNVLKNFTSVTSTDKYNSQYYLRRLLFHLFDASSEFLITELSSDGLGMIDNYSKIIKPDYSIITSIGNAHIEDFKSLENIIKEKTSIIPYTFHKVFIPIEYKDLIINEDNVKNHLNKIVFVENNFKVIENNITSFVEFQLTNKDKIIINNSNFHGNHNYSNMNLILHLLDEIGFLNENKNIENVIKTFENLTPFPGRGNTIKVNKNNFDFEIICEYHNSNSLSFMAALKNIKTPTLVIMGFMYSLGEESDEKHHELLNIMENHPYIKYILTYDKNIYKLNLDAYEKILIKNLKSHENFNNILMDLLNKLKSENINNIFVKGSRSSKLELVIKDILDICQK
jgi:UDP-N-acetylmuramoyl-tripeptide--D-alanyl-D-alanine ligase